ncbi:MAG: putative glycosyltransferase [Actinomycetota bacterium]|jgi:glycosyltransferase involved in cell wall biosynthesis
MPILNEERHLRAAVLALFNQDYSEPFEIVLAVGPSIDRTWEIAEELAAEFNRIKVVPNPSGRTPDALNAAIKVASGDIIIRCDGHAELPTNYVSTAVRVLAETGADNVGGIMDAEGTNDFENAVAVAMKSKFGVGAAAFHVGGTAGAAETVYLGCFRAEALKRVGGYDPKMTRAQDWEMNFRIRQTGGLIWFTPELKVTYRPRPSLRALAKQYFQYGQWRREVMRMHPDTVGGKSGLRYLVPPLTVLANAVGVISILAAIGNPIYLFGASGLFVYLLALKLVTLSRWRELNLKSLFWLGMAFITMHHSWGIGFLKGVKP